MVNDVIIVGGGIAGLTAAYFLSKKYNVTVINESSIKIKTSSTQMAQGGIAATQNWESHIKDTLSAGGYKNNKKIVEIFCKEAWGAVEFLKNEIEVPFKKTPVLEGAHSENRVWTTGDNTGDIIYKHLKEKCKNRKNISRINGRALSILKNKENEVCGVLYESNGDKKDLFSSYVIISTGGIGGLFEYSTNPENLKGDGILMAYDANAKIEDLDNIQFHPTGLKSNDFPVFLLSEALRGEGALIRNEKGERFLNHLPQKELSARNIVVKEMLKQKECFLDLKDKSKKFWEGHFPNICKKLTEKNFDIEKNLIPIIPTEHFLCGGIKTNEFGETTVKNLFAIGECASTGLHGINRLASNSLSEAVVFAKRCSEKICNFPKIKSQLVKDYKICTKIIKRADLKTLKKIRTCMQENLKPESKNKKELKFCLEKIKDCFEKKIALLFCL